MSFQKIMAGETDTNSPLNQALMDKIRENFDYLAANMVLVYMDTERVKTIAGGNWTTIKQGYIFVPSYVYNLVFQVEGFYSYDAYDRKFRVRIKDGSGGDNISEEVSAPQGGYALQALTVPASGAFAGAGDWRLFRVESKHGDLNDRDVYMRTVAAKVGVI
ncbi:MAG: hypothetical protein R6V10_02225 [bacterium]